MKDGRGEFAPYPRRTALTLTLTVWTSRRTGHVGRFPGLTNGQVVGHLLQMIAEAGRARNAFLHCKLTASAN